LRLFCALAPWRGKSHEAKQEFRAMPQNLQSPAKVSSSVLSLYRESRPKGEVF
jgi:hypothetical protein